MFCSIAPVVVPYLYNLSNGELSSAPVLPIVPGVLVSSTWSEQAREISDSIVRAGTALAPSKKVIASSNAV
jgi:hypothetical protein